MSFAELSVILFITAIGTPVERVVVTYPKQRRFHFGNAWQVGQARQFDWLSSPAMLARENVFGRHCCPLIGQTALTLDSHWSKDKKTTWPENVIS